MAVRLDPSRPARDELRRVVIEQLVSGARGAGVRARQGTPRRDPRRAQVGQEGTRRAQAQPLGARSESPSRRAGGATGHRPAARRRAGRGCPGDDRERPGRAIRGAAPGNGVQRAPPRRQAIAGVWRPRIAPRTRPARSGHCGTGGHVAARAADLGDGPRRRAPHVPRGRDEFATARNSDDGDVIHEWRKRVKDLWYQQRLLRDAWSPVLRAYADQADELGEALGDDHDLAVLAAALESRQDQLSARLELERMLELIARRRGSCSLAPWRSARGCTRRSRRPMAGAPAPISRRPAAGRPDRPPPGRNCVRSVPGHRTATCPRPGVPILERRRAPHSSARAMHERPLVRPADATPLRVGGPSLFCGIRRAARLWTTREAAAPTARRRLR